MSLSPNHLRPNHFEPGFGASAGQSSLRKSPLRAALLGCVAIATLGGIALDAAMFTSSALAANVQSAGPASFADIVDHVKGAVVSVKVKVVETASMDGENTPDMQGMPPFPPGSPMDRFFHQFNPQSGPAKPHTGQALGSGFFISADGYVVTNNHVVENAKDVSITTYDGKSYDAKIIGVDKKTDLALLKVASGGNFPFVNFSAHTPRVGDWVIAVGNPFGLGGTVTAGIVSARGRDIGNGPYDDFLQIDAPVNRGNSGGPTFNAEGDVVGVNTAIYSPSGGSVGIGFAIPSDTVKSVVAALKDKGVVARSYIGVQIQPVTADIADSLGLKSTKGALIAEAQKDGPGAQSGLKSGDIITQVNGEVIEGPRELARKISALAPDSTAAIVYLHDGAEKKLEIKVAAMPGEQQASLAAPEAARSEFAALGFQVAPATSVPGAGKTGLVVSGLDPEGIAAQKGLKSGDVILEAAGNPISRPSELVAAFDAAKKEGKKALLLRVKTGDGARFVALATNS